MTSPGITSETTETSQFSPAGTLQRGINFKLYTSQTQKSKSSINQILLPSSRRQLTDTQRQQSLEEESVWLRIRSLTLRLLAFLAGQGHAPSPQNSEVTTENGVGDKTSILSSLLSQLNQTLQTANQMAEKCTQVGSKQTTNVGVFFFKSTSRRLHDLNFPIEQLR